MKQKEKKQSRRGPVERQAYRVAEFCEAYAIGETKFHDEVAKGRLTPVKVGRMTIIPKAEAEAWLKRYQAQCDQPPKLVAGASGR